MELSSPKPQKTKKNYADNIFYIFPLKIICYISGWNFLTPSLKKQKSSP